MCTEKEIMDYCKQLEELPAPLSPERLKALYGPAMERSRGFIHMAFAPSIADVVVSLLCETGHTMMRIASQAAEVASTLLTPSPTPQPVFATRSFGGSSRRAAADSLMIEKPGAGGYRLHVEMKAGAKNLLDVHVLLLDDKGNRVKPFELSVSDSETGEILLKPTRYASGEVVLHGVEPGLYAITAIAGEAVSTLSLRIEELA